KLLEKEQSIEVLFSNNLLVSGENSLTKTKSNSVYSVYLSYIKHWKIRYNTLKEPALTKKLSGQIKLLLRDFKDMREIDKMLEAFISCDEGYLISKMHDFGLFLCDLNKWRALSNNPQLAKIFTIEYAKNRMYLQKKEMVQKEEEKRREQENIERIRQEKIQLEIYKQEQERKKKEEQELLKKQKEELERQRKEEEKRLAESFRKHLEANYVERKA
ncbi:MAG: cell envelope integrity protein TolA, partial [Leptonema sp. (in: bacteria)]